MKRGKLYPILLAVGILLVVASLSVLLISNISQKSAADRARKLVIDLRQLMPSSYNAGLDDRVNILMASMEVEGESFCGIIEIPAYNADLPICDVWSAGKVSQYPCRYTGSIYDRSLIIGGSDRSGQFDFMNQITGGDKVYVTDMTGGRYTYQVRDVLRSTDVSSDKLMSLDGDLVLYARNSYSFDYTFVICKLG